MRLNKMEKYDYKQHVKDDVRDYLERYSDLIVALDDHDSVHRYFLDRMWNVNDVTGNARGSYTDSQWEAEENLCHNWDLLAEACKAKWMDNNNVILEGAEYCDVLIRCHLLSDCLTEVLNEIENQ